MEAKKPGEFKTPAITPKSSLDTGSETVELGTIQLDEVNEVEKRHNEMKKELEIILDDMKENEYHLDHAPAYYTLEELQNVVFDLKILVEFMVEVKKEKGKLPLNSEYKSKYFKMDPVVLKIYPFLPDIKPIKGSIEQGDKDEEHERYWYNKTMDLYSKYLVKKYPELASLGKK